MSAGRTASRGGTPNKEASSQDIYARMVALEKDLRVRDTQVEQLSSDKRALEKVGKNKEASLIALTNELLEAKKQISRLELELVTKSEESKTLFEREKINYTQLIGAAESVRSKEVDGKAAMPTDLYHHVMRLENELRDRDRVIGVLQEENKGLHKLIKQREDEFLLLTEELQQTKTKLISSVDPVLTENRIKELMQNIVELQEENRMLLSIQKAKTQAIEELTQELNVRGASEQLLEQMRGEAKSRDREIQRRDEENTRLQKTIEYQETVMNKYRSEEVGVPVQMWMEERRLLQAEVQKHYELKAQMEKTIKGQKERINQLQESLDVIVKSYDGGKSPSATLRSHRRSKNLSSSNSSDSPPSSLNNSANFENGSALFNEQSFTGEGTVPYKLYELLEKNVQRMAITLAAKEALLSEKDDGLELLEKKLDVLTKARATDIKKSKKQELEIQSLKEKIGFIETEKREQTQQLTLELTKLKRKTQLKK